MGTSQIKKFYLTFRVIKLDWIGDLGVFRVWELFGFDKLLKVRVEHIRQFLIFLAALEFKAEFEEMRRYIVVKVQ